MITRIYDKSAKHIYFCFVSIFWVTTLLVTLADGGDAPALFAKKLKKFKELPLPSLGLAIIGLIASIVMALLLPGKIYEYITTAAGILILLIKCFVIGFIMSITSPLSILFWLGIYGSILAKMAQVNGTGMLLVYSSMIFLGLTLWDILVAGLTTGLRRFLTLASLKMISIFSDISLIGFSLYFGYQGIEVLYSH